MNAAPLNTPASGKLPFSGSPDPLSQLRDIHLPETISWWPPAPGWWLLLLLLLSLFVTVEVCWRRYRNKNAYRRQALLELTALLRSWDSKQNDADFVEQTQEILRRTALSAYPDSEASKLSGENWVRWLNRSLPKPTADESFHSLGKNLYMPEPEKVDIQQLYQSAQHWIKKHRRQEIKNHA